MSLATLIPLSVVAHLNLESSSAAPKEQGTSIPDAVQRYLDLGELLNRNRLPAAAESAIRATRLGLISGFSSRELQALMAIGQDRQQRIVEEAARKQVAYPFHQAA